MTRHRQWLFALSCLAALAYGLGLYLAGHGPGIFAGPDRLTPALDDAAIYFQYARQALQGEWLHYSPGSGLSTGATSFSYGLLLTAFMGLGLQGPSAAWLIGALALLLAVVSADKLSRHQFPALPAWWAGALVLSQGAWVAASFNGLETGLFLALSLASIEALSRRSSSSLGWLAMLAWTRPEGQWLCLALGSAWALSPDGPLKGAARRGLLIASLALAPSALLWALSGSPVPDSVRPKASDLDGSQGLLAHAASASSYAVGVLKGAWMGFWGGADSVGRAGDAAARNPIGPHAAPLALLAALIGFFHLGARGQRSLAAALLAALAGLLALLAWQLPVGWHSHRYLCAGLPLLSVGMLACLALLREAGPLGRAVCSAFFVLWMGFGLAAWPWHLQRSVEGAHDYARCNRNAALQLAQLPAGPVAGVDAGILAYYSGRPFIDLLGITDHAMALAHAQGKGATLEALLRKGAQRPVWSVLHDDRPDYDPAAWRALGLLKMVDAGWAPGMALERWDFSGSEALSEPASQQLPVLGSLNVADLEDEAARHASFSGPSAQGTRLARLRLKPGGIEAPEGGRLVQSLGFDLEAGAAALMLRTSLEGPGRLRVDSHGASVLKALGPNRADTYGEHWVALPPQAAGRVELTLLDASGKPLEWALYRVWVLPAAALRLVK